VKKLSLFVLVVWFAFLSSPIYGANTYTGGFTFTIHNLGTCNFTLVYDVMNGGSGVSSGNALATVVAGSTVTFFQAVSGGGQVDSVRIRATSPGGVTVGTIAGTVTGVSPNQLCTFSGSQFIDVGVASSCVATGAVCPGVLNTYNISNGDPVTHNFAVYSNSTAYASVSIGAGRTYSINYTASSCAPIATWSAVCVDCYGSSGSGGLSDGSPGISLSGPGSGSFGGPNGTGYGGNYVYNSPTGGGTNGPITYTTNGYSGAVASDATLQQGFNALYDANLKGFNKLDQDLTANAANARTDAASLNTSLSGVRSDVQAVTNRIGQQQTQLHGDLQNVTNLLGDIRTDQRANTNFLGQQVGLSREFTNWLQSVNAKTLVLTQQNQTLHSDLSGIASNFDGQRYDITNAMERVVQGQVSNTMALTNFFAPLLETGPITNNPAYVSNFVSISNYFSFTNENTVTVNTTNPITVNVTITNSASGTNADRDAAYAALSDLTALTNSGTAAFATAKGAIEGVFSGLVLPTGADSGAPDMVITIAGQAVDFNPFTRWPSVGLVSRWSFAFVAVVAFLKFSGRTLIDDVIKPLSEMETGGVPDLNAEGSLAGFGGGGNLAGALIAIAVPFVICVLFTGVILVICGAISAAVSSYFSDIVGDGIPGVFWYFANQFVPIALVFGLLLSTIALPVLTSAMIGVTSFILRFLPGK